MSGVQLSVRIKKNLRLEYLGEVRLVKEIEIGGCEILICKNPLKKGIVRERVY